MPEFTAAELAEHLQGRVVGDPTLRLTGFAPAETAGPGDLTWAETTDYLARAEAGAAGAVLVGTPAPSRKTLICVDKPRVAFARILPLFFPEPAFPPGIHPSAVVDPSAAIDPTAHVGPRCTVSSGACIGARSVLVAGVFVGPGARVGEDVRVFPNVVLYEQTVVGNRVRLHAGVVVGSDGFGYVFDQGAHRKVPQVGHVVIEDDVEIGANSTVDRGALGTTVIGRGTKIDNLVQVAHNVVLGRHCILVAQVGIAGSARLGDYVTVAGQAGVIGHLKIGSRAVIAAQSGVTANMPDGQTWFGSPARPATQMKRQILAVERLPELARRVARLEAALAARTSPASAAPPGADTPPS